jgi:hypothetical protein
MFAMIRVQLVIAIPATSPAERCHSLCFPSGPGSFTGHRCKIPRRLTAVNRVAAVHSPGSSRARAGVARYTSRPSFNSMITIGVMRNDGWGFTRTRSCRFGFLTGTVVSSFLTPTVPVNDWWSNRKVVGSKGLGTTLLVEISVTGNSLIGGGRALGLDWSHRSSTRLVHRFHKRTPKSALHQSEDHHADRERRIDRWCNPDLGQQLAGRRAQRNTMLFALLRVGRWLDPNSGIHVTYLPSRNQDLIAPGAGQHEQLDRRGYRPNGRTERLGRQTGGRTILRRMDRASSRAAVDDHVGNGPIVIRRSRTADR